MDKTTETPDSQSAYSNQPSKPYGRNWKKLILIYLIIGAVLYGGIYYFVLSKQNSKQYSHPTTKTSLSPSTTPDPTADWKTHTNTKYGFSFKLPEQFTIDERDSQQPPQVYSALIYDNSKPKITIEGGSTNPYMYITVTESKDSVLEYLNIKPTGLTYENIKVGENQFTHVKETDRMANKVNDVNYIKKGNYIFSIANSHAPIDESIFNQILSTFKFTTQEQAVPTQSGQEYIDFNGKQIRVVRVGEGEYCEGRVGLNDFDTAKCSTGLKCQFREGTAEDAPGTCVKE